MPVEIGPEWDPAAHDYGNGTFFAGTEEGRTAAMIMGLTALAAFGAAGVYAGFTYAAAVAGEATSISYTIGGSTIIAGGTAMTSGQAAVIAVAEAEGMTGFGAALLEVIIDGGFTALFSAEGIVALSLFDHESLSPGIYGNIGGWLGQGLPGGSFGGSGTPPGFPGFPANTVYGNFSGTYGCILVFGEYQCYWYH